MKVGLFDLTVHLAEDAFELEVFAGRDRDQLQSAQDRYRIVQAMRIDIVREILLKLERALAGNESAIDVNVAGNTAIVRDTTFPLPAPSPAGAADAATPASLPGKAVQPPATTIKLDARAIAISASPSPRNAKKAARPRAGGAKKSKQPPAVAQGGRGKRTTPEESTSSKKKTRAKASSKAGPAKRTRKPRKGNV